MRGHSSVGTALEEMRGQEVKIHIKIGMLESEMVAQIASRGDKAGQTSQASQTKSKEKHRRLKLIIRHNHNVQEAIKALSPDTKQLYMGDEAHIKVKVAFERGPNPNPNPKPNPNPNHNLNPNLMASHDDGLT